MTDAISRAGRPQVRTLTASASASAASASPLGSKGFGKSDSLARVKSTGKKGLGEKKAQYIVMESAASKALLGKRIPAKFDPNLQRGNGWFVAELTPTEVRTLRASKVELYPNKRVDVGPKPQPLPGVTAAPRTSLFRDVHGVSALQKEAGWEGEGVCVTIIDTGIGKNDNLTVTKFDDVKTEAPEDPPSDGHGHGTHCSGSSTAHGDLEQGQIRGMAPKAKLQGVKVLDDRGSGTWADVMKGIERAIEWAKAYDGPTVCSMSLGGSGSGDPDEVPMNKLINEAVEKYGIYFSVAAGNSGPKEGTVLDPGRARGASTIAAVDHKGTVESKDDVLANFSSRDVKGGRKPQHGADGVNQESTLPDNKVGKMSGTSMATPVNAGGVAVLLGKAWALWKAGKFKVDPRELVKSRELDKILGETAVKLPNAPQHHQGDGDIRIDAAAKLLIERYGK